MNITDSVNQPGYRKPPIPGTTKLHQPTKLLHLTGISILVLVLSSALISSLTASAQPPPEASQSSSSKAAAPSVRKSAADGEEPVLTSPRETAAEGKDDHLRGDVQLDADDAPHVGPRSGDVPETAPIAGDDDSVTAEKIEDKPAAPADDDSGEADDDESVAIVGEGENVGIVRGEEAKTNGRKTGAQGLAGTPDAHVARVRVLEGTAAVDRYEDEKKDLATINSPVYSGDAVSTGASGRMEIQLGNGWLVRLDKDTRVVFVSLPVVSDPSDRSALLQLSRGAIGVELRAGAPPGGGFQVDAAGGSVQLLSTGRYRIDTMPQGTLQVSCYRGSAEVSGKETQATIHSGQRTAIDGKGGEPRQARSFNTAETDDFEEWIDRQNVQYVTSRSEGGDEPAVDEERIPDSVDPYRSELDSSGRWVDTQEYGTVWVPNGQDKSWTPYSNGHWDDGPYGQFWVSYDPWGWAPYHYGRWAWNVSWGWGWCPGSVFAPAWVSWYYGPSYVGWCPLGYWNTPCSYWGGWYGYDFHCWRFTSWNHCNNHHVNNHFSNPSHVQHEIGTGKGVAVRDPVNIKGVRANQIKPDQIVARAKALSPNSVVDMKTVGKIDPSKASTRASFRDSDAERSGGRVGRGGRASGSGRESVRATGRQPGSGSGSGRGGVDVRGKGTVRGADTGRGKGAPPRSGSPGAGGPSVRTPGRGGLGGRTNSVGPGASLQDGRGGSRGIDRADRGPARDRTDLSDPNRWTRPRQQASPGRGSEYRDRWSWSRDRQTSPGGRDRSETRPPSHGYGERMDGRGSSGRGSPRGYTPPRSGGSGGVRGSGGYGGGYRGPSGGGYRAPSSGGGRGGGGGPRAGGGGGARGGGGGARMGGGGGGGRSGGGGGGGGRGGGGGGRGGGGGGGGRGGGGGGRGR